MDQLILVRAIYDLLTLYMLLILLRWLGPWLELELDVGYRRYIGKSVDPLVNRLRRSLPPLGPVDFSHLVALFAVWVVRMLSYGLLTGYNNS
jgi:YggT family protein